jgi:N6-L-threonylcarbamoyladenine synthase
MTLVLGIETSCDETAAAVIADGTEICSNVVASQIELHRQYGGVFPEMASRQHVKAIVPVVGEALAEAGVDWGDLDAIAVTHGPGLAGSLLVGVNVSKGLAYGCGLPLIGVNHLEAHIATNWLAGSTVWDLISTGPAAFPLLCLIVSGGHTSLILMHGLGRYEHLGSTLDDAAGEAFDKVARLLGLGYPGGPAVQQAAEDGDPTAYSFTRARLDRDYDFSFSGLKTAVLRAVQVYVPEVRRPSDGRRRAADVPEGAGPYTERRLRPKTVADLAASFQATVVETLVEKTERAASEYKVRGVLMAGGVAANGPLRERMQAALSVPLGMPPIALATDNATGVGVAGYWALQRGEVADWDLDVVPRLRLA